MSEVHIRRSNWGRIVGQAEVYCGDVNVQWIHSLPVLSVDFGQLEDRDWANDKGHYANLCRSCVHNYAVKIRDAWIEEGRKDSSQYPEVQESVQSFVRIYTKIAEETEAIRCPDGGFCHHRCAARWHCWRVQFANPLSGAGETWADVIRKEVGNG